MEKVREWVEAEVHSAFSPVDALTVAYDQENPKARYEPGKVFPIMIGLRRGDAESFAAKVENFTQAVNKSGVMGRPMDDPIVAIPPYYVQPDYGKPGKEQQSAEAQKSAEQPRNLVWINLLVSGDFLMMLSLPSEAIEAENPVNDVWQFELGLPLSEDALPDEFEGGFEPLPEVIVPDGPPPKDFVVTAIIDDGLPIANTRFRNSMLDSRVEYAWVQDGIFRGTGSHVANGREFDKSQIDDLLDKSVVGGQVDEDRFYRLAKITEFGIKKGHTRLAARFTHGANVMDQAAGYGAGDPDMPGDNPIIAVQLPAATTADTSGLSLNGNVVDALHYILHRADLIAKKRGTNKVNLVINFSYGFIAGPHDGTHPLEIMMDKLLKKRNAHHPITAITLPAGNSRQSMCHGQIKGCNSGGPTTPAALTWHILPDDRTPSYGVCYMPTTPTVPATSRVEMRMVLPDGTGSPFIKEISGSAWEYREGGTGPVLAKISYQYVSGPTKRGRFVVAVRPTMTLTAGKPIINSGNWKIEIKNNCLKSDEVIEAYIQRDDTPFGFVGKGRQSHFVDPDYQRYTVQGAPVDHDSPDAYVKRSGTLNGLATGHETIVMGGFDRVYGKPALYSAAGPTLADAAGTPGRDGPDVAGISDTTRVTQGVLGGGTRSGAVFALNGTSVAGPQIGRKIAQVMAKGTWSGNADVATWVTEPGPPYWPPVKETRVGAGRVVTKALYPIARVDAP